MARAPGHGRSRVVGAAALLLVALASPVAARQAAVQAPAAASAQTPSLVPAPLSGPRLREEPRPIEPRFTAARESRVFTSNNSTISVGTIVLVVAVVIVVLLLVR